MDRFEKVTYMIFKYIATSIRKMFVPYCEDCKHWDPEGSFWENVGYCNFHNKDFCHNDFCSYGERTKKCSKDAHDVDLHGYLQRR